MLTLLGFLFSLNSSAFAATIEDPNGCLATIDQGRAKHAFSERFRLNDAATFRLFTRNHQWGCEESGCWVMSETVNQDFEKKIVEVTEDTATAVGSDGSTEVFSREELAAYDDSLLKKNLAEMDVFLGMNGKVVLEAATPAEFALANGATIPSYVLTGHFAAEKGNLNFEFTVGKDVPGMAEILFVHFGAPVMKTKIFKYKSLPTR